MVDIAKATMDDVAPPDSAGDGGRKDARYWSGSLVPVNLKVSTVHTIYVPSYGLTRSIQLSSFIFLL